MLRTKATRTSAEILNQVSASSPPNHITQRLFRNTFTLRFISHVFPPFPILSALVPSHTASHQPEALLTYTTALPASIFQKIASQLQLLHSSLYTITRFTRENLILSNVGDRGEMGHSMEEQTPFLDYHLTKYVNALPANTKIRAVTREDRDDGVDARHGARTEDRNTDAAKEQITEKYVLRDGGNLHPAQTRLQRARKVHR